MSTLRRIVNWCARQSVAIAHARFEEALRRTTPPLLAKHNVRGLQASWIIARRSTDAAMRTLCFGSGAERGLRFRLGSISKPITAVTTLALVRDGVLGLDEPLDTELAPFAFGAPRDWLRAVTPRLLLSHTAGLKELNPPRGAPSDVAADWLDASLVQWEAAPATRTLYSGAGYALLERVIEGRMRTSFASVVRRIVFEPLGVPECCYECELTEHAGEHSIANVAIDRNEQGDPATVSPSLCAASSGLVATASDVCTLMHRALFDSFLPSGLTRALLWPQPPSLAGALFTTGLRIHSGSHGTDAQSLTHAGVRPGHRSVLVIVPASRAIACLATNAKAGSAILKPLTGLFREINRGTER